MPEGAQNNESRNDRGSAGKSQGRSGKPGAQGGARSGGFKGNRSSGGYKGAGRQGGRPSGGGYRKDGGHSGGYKGERKSGERMERSGGRSWEDRKSHFGDESRGERGERQGGYKGSRGPSGNRREGGKPRFDGERKGGYKGDRRESGKPRREGGYKGERQGGDRKPRFEGERRDRQGGFSRDGRGDRKPRFDDRRDGRGDRKRFEERDRDERAREDDTPKAGDMRFQSGSAMRVANGEEERPERKGFAGWDNRDQPKRSGNYGKTYSAGSKRKSGPNGARSPKGSRGLSGEAPRSLSPARLAALQVTRLVRERDAFAADLIQKHIDSSRMSREDRAFATRLTLGVVSSCGTLDEVLNRCLDNPTDVQPDVRDALRISVYEIIFLEKEDHAAVDQGVDLVRAVEPKAAGLANAVLRRVIEAKKAFPFGDPRSDFSAYSRLHAFPQWLAKLAVEDLGPQAARDYMAASNEPAPLYIAVNPARATDAEVCEVVEASHGEPTGVSIDGEPVVGCYKLAEGRVLFDGRVRYLIAQGKLLVSDAASQRVAQLVLPDEKPASFLEIGAGRGTKTILLQGNAQRMWGSQIEEYVTLDNLAFKTELTRERVETYGVNVSEALTGDACDLDAAVGERTFEAVFIDAPCSGLGTLRRHPEIRWRLDAAKIPGFAERGLAMLKSAASHVAPGGTLSFATCTVARAENVEVVKAFLASEEGAGFSLATMGGKPCFATNLVSGGPDAHFAVKMMKAK